MNLSSYLRTLIILRALLFAISTALPQMASVMAFITYSLLGHPIDAATIFSSLALFQLLRISLVMLRKLSFILRCPHRLMQLSYVYQCHLRCGHSMRAFI